MNKNYIAFLLLLSLGSAQISRAGRTGRAIGIGAVSGIAAGLITSKIAANCAQPAPIAVAPVAYPAAYYVYEDPSIEEQRAELRMRERQVYEAQMQQKKRDQEQRQREEERRYREQVRQERQERQNQLMQQQAHEAKLVQMRPVVPVAIKSADRSRELALKERELALKEQQVQLELTKERNKRKELELKDKELEIQLIRARKENYRKN